MTEPTPVQLEFFEKEVRPLLANRCFRCHGPKKQQANLRLNSLSTILKGGDTGPALVPGKPNESLLVEAISYDPEGYQMPPTGKLPEEEIAILTRWVEMGAPWPKHDAQPTPSADSSDEDSFDLQQRAQHWSFQPIFSPSPPKVEQSDWPRTVVDRFILARLESEGLSPASPADKRTLLRRVTYDLIGLPPTTEEIRDFLNDDSPQAYEKVVDRLLASPHYGERWARHWLDLVRFAETAGHEFDYKIPHAWPYRDYVVRALNADVPYDQFVVEHIAGDLLEQPRRNPANGINESVIGTAFYWFPQGKHSPVDIRAEECDVVDNQIDVMTKTFLGLTVSCARCHDHKFDPITTKDYYALAGYLQSSRRQFASIDNPEASKKIAGRLKDLKSSHRGAFVEQTLKTETPLLDRLADCLLAASRENPKKGDSPSPFTSQEINQIVEYLQDTASKDQANLFYPWTVLGTVDDPQEFARRRSGLVHLLRSRLTKATQPSSGTEVFEDFEKVDYEGWFVQGRAFGSRPAQAGDGIVQTETPIQPVQPAVPGTAHSGLVSDKLQGVLRSKTFTIKKPFIHYRMHRWGGRKSPGRQVKNGQVHLVIDGFQYIKNPIYGGLTINVRQTKRPQWYRQDVRKWVGHTAYIEIVDEEEQGHISVDQILFSEKSSPPESPNRLVLDLLDDPNLQSPEALAQGYQRLFTKTADLWRKGKLANQPTASERGELLNWLIAHDFIDSKTSSGKVPPSVTRAFEDYKTVESHISKPRISIAMTDGTPENEHVLIRGNHKKPGDEVPRRFLEVLGGKKHTAPETGSGRLQLARQMVDPSNPLVARVMVNRVWLHYFGRGIVTTPDNFGVLGKPPSHPKLLDYLATEFVENGWSLKQLHRMIVLSNTYRMSSKPKDRQAEESDPDNKLLHRMPVKRLEGEVIRDAILALSGRLDRKMGGPGVLPHLTPFMEGRGRPSRSGPLDGNGRRSLYINVRRNFLTPLFLAFDYPTPLTTRGRRSVSNVPAQALTMMNNPFVVQQARVWAERLMVEVPDSPEKRVKRLYEMAYGRLPTDDELDSALSFLEEQGRSYNGPNDPRTWADLCHIVMNVKEFIFIP